MTMVRKIPHLVVELQAVIPRPQIVLIQRFIMALIIVVSLIRIIMQILMAI